MSQSYRDLMRELSNESSDKLADLDKEPPKSEVQPGARPMGQVEIALPWEDAIHPDLDNLSVMLESRGWEIVGHHAIGTASFEGQEGDGTMVGSKGSNGGDGADNAVSDGDTDGIANDVVNGIYIKPVVPKPVVTIIRPEDVLPAVDASEVLYLKAENEEAAEEMQAYLATEGRIVAINPAQVADLLDKKFR